jgi:hypothetical protein
MGASYHRRVADQTPTVVGPDVLIPGSDFLLAGLGRVMLLIGVVVLVVAVVLRVRAARRGPEHRRRPVLLVSAAAVLGVGGLLTAAYWPPAFFAPEFPPLPRLLPEDAVFYRQITDLPVAEDSDRMIASQGGLPLGSGFRSVVQEGVLWGNPFNIVEADTPMMDVEITQYPEFSHLGRYPMTDPAYIEGLPTYHFDQHYLAIDLERRQNWELIAARRWFGRWQAGAGATWSMDSLDYPDGRTIAAGLPLLPGTITYDEVAGGRIDHLLLGASPITASGEFIWPARATDGRSEDPDAPPMGAWFRLRSDVDLSGLGPQARVIAEAAQRYGILMSDTGPGFGLRGTPDARWDERDLDTLGQITTDDFEVVDASAVMVDVDSMAARR